VGILDAIKRALGTNAEADATRPGDPEALFGMSTASVTMEANLDYVPTNDAALCFAEVDSTDFHAAVDEVDAILEVGRQETGTGVEFDADEYGYRWIILEDPEFEDLVTSIHFAADTLVEEGFGSRLLAAVFAFEHIRDGHYAYWIYSFRRGSFYPFVPDEHGDNERDEQVEFKLESTLSGELDVEDDKSFWYPLWPDRPGFHPWE
jgi:hypothetical protein